MAIPASHIVKVAPRVIDGHESNLEISGLILSRNPLISASQLVLSFKSAKSVGEYFGLDSQEFKGATIYFNSYENKFTAPKELLFARRIDTQEGAVLRGGPLKNTLGDLQEVTDGILILTIDQQSYTLSGLDFSGANSFSEVASIIENKLCESLPQFSVIYSSHTGGFIVTSPTLGASSTIDFAKSPPQGLNVAALLALGEEQGATISLGQEPLSPSEQMSKILAKTENWVSFTTLWEASSEENKQWAQWANDNYGW
ncbi:MAG: DUF3383 family protein, partial [Candidatus Adiutrix sp.]